MEKFSLIRIRGILNQAGFELTQIPRISIPDSDLQIEMGLLESIHPSNLMGELP